MTWSWWCFGSSTVPLMAALHTSRWLQLGLHQISRFWSDLNDINPSFWAWRGSKVWIVPMIHAMVSPNVMHGDWKWNFLRLLLLLLWWSSLPSRRQGRWSEISWLKSSITQKGVSIQGIPCMVLIKVFGPAQSVDWLLIDVGLWITFLIILLIKIL